MVYIEIAQPERLKPTSLSKLSAFVSFEYDSNLVSIIKSMGTRVYIPDKKTWEIPESAVPMLMSRLRDYDVLLRGEMRHETPESHAQLPSGFVFTTKPYKHQMEGVIYGLEHESFLLGDDQGLGKALSLSTLIYTPTGAKTIKDIEVGDKVFDDEGNIQTVSNVYNHTDVQMYDITFSDGVVIRCCKDHLWGIIDQGKYKVVDTNWFLKENHLGVRRADALRNKTNWNYYIPLCKPVNFEVQDLPLDPYLVGCLLGDGSITGTSVGFTTSDDFIVQELNKILYPDYTLKSSDSMQSIDYNIIKTEMNEDFGNPRKVNKIRKALEDMALMGTNSHSKFIPDIFKFNSVENRISILQGLMDTDGYASEDNLTQYTTVSERLKDDVRFLVESLGGMARVSECDGAYTLTIQLYDPTILFRLPRKLNRVKKRKFKPHRNIVKIEEAGREDAKCISVTGSSELYVCEHFVVTHNTKEIIDLAMCRKQTDGIKHCLIICGINGNKYNWADEVKIHSREDSWILGTRFTKRPPIKMIEGSTKDKMEDLNNIPHQFFWITNIETLRGGSFKENQGKRTVTRFPIAEKIQELCDRGIIGMIAFDEAHKAKNPDSQQGKALLSIDCKGPKIPMSGTFVLNNPLDLYLPLKWAGFETHSFYAYKQHYCKMGGFGGKEIVGYKNLDELRSMVSKVMLRRVKGDVLDLPPKVHTIEWVDAYPEQKSLYKDVRDQVRDNIDKVKVHPDPLSEMLRLRQVTGYPGILSSTVTKSAKMDRMEELVEDEVSVGGKAIIFSNWSEMTNVIRHKLKKYNPAYITGEVGSVQRMEEKDRFQNDPNCKVMIGTIGALGTGFTLTAAQLVIFVDEPWNRGIKDQAEDRAHRIGTRGTVRVVTILTRDTVDEGVYNLVQKKGKMADLLVDGKVDGKNVDNVLSYLLTFGG